MTKHPNRIKTGRALVWLLLPSLLGMLAFYLIPFGMSLGYSAVDNVRDMNFVGVQNYINILQNPVFLRALRNTLLFIAVCVPLNMGASFLLASGLRSVRRGSAFFALVFMLPLVIPSGSVVFLWNCLFGVNGLLNKFLVLGFGASPVNWLESSAALPIVVLIFIWKNVGYNMILFRVGLDLIPKEYYDYAQLEGAGTLASFRHITAIYLMPTTFLVLLMSIVNSFKSFREIYMLLGPLPQGGVYMLQHYIISQFINLNLPILSAAATILAALVTVLVLVLLRTQRRLQYAYL